MKIDYTRHYLKFHADAEAEERHIVDCENFLPPFLPSNRKARILDIGCGMGLALSALRRLGYENLSGVEVDEHQAEFSRKRGLAVDLCDDTVTWLRQRESGFDFIMALDVLEHIPVAAQLEFVRAIRTALRDSGRFFCRVPNANSVLAGRYRYIDWTHETSFTEHSLDFVLFNGGFSNPRVFAEPELPPPPRYWLPFLSGSRHWWARKFFRCWRRLELMAELEPKQGRVIPISANLLCIADKQPDESKS